MSRTQPKVLYGVHQATVYERDTRIPYGDLRVLKGSSLNISGELVKLSGGSMPYDWDAQDGAMTAELALKPAEIPNWMFKVFLGKSPTEVLNDPGSVDNFENVKNLTVFDATAGIATATIKVGSEDDLKFGKYVVVALTPSTVDVYSLANVDSLRGPNDLPYLDDDLRIATGLTITLATATEVPNLGVELTGGSGPIAMVAGDTAIFDVKPPSLIKTSVKIGELGTCVPEFGAILTSQKLSDGTMWLFDCYRVKALGFPLQMEEKAYNEAEITASLIYDAVKDGVFNMDYVKPSSGCV